MIRPGEYPASRTMTTNQIQYIPKKEIDEEQTNKTVLQSDRFAAMMEQNQPAELKFDLQNQEEFVNGHELNLEESKTVEGGITVYDSFITPESDGYSLDFISKNRTNDNIRRNFLSRLTY